MTTPTMLLQTVRHLALPRPVVLLLLMPLLSGGGGDGADQPLSPQRSPPPATPSRISGHVMVPPNDTIEVEPNNTISQAQVLSSISTVFGRAAASDAGFPLPGVPNIQLQDLYRVNTTGKVRITLTIAEDDLVTNDLALVLMNSSGTVLDVSEGLVDTEMVEIPGAGNFLMGVRAFAGASAYVLFSQARSIARFHNIDSRFKASSQI